jgi:hypothetical protein
MEEYSCQDDDSLSGDPAHFCTQTEYVVVYLVLIDVFHTQVDKPFGMGGIVRPLYWHDLDFLVVADESPGE